MTDFSSRNFGKWQSKTYRGRVVMDDATLATARKVFALVQRGGTQGEKDAAYARLASMAKTAKIETTVLVGFLSGAA